jgi:O-antigen ligase
MIPRPANSTTEWSSWLAYGIITAIYLSIPFGSKFFSWLALFGSIVGWIAILADITRKTRNNFSTESIKILKYWFFIGVVYFLLHLAQVSSADQIRRLDAPIRILILSGLIALPILARKRLEEYVITLSVSGIIFGAMTVIQLLKDHSAGRYFGLYDYHNLMALAALVNTIMLLWLIKEKTALSKKYLIFAGIIGGIVACLLSGTRASWLLIVITTSYYLVIQRGGNISKRLTAVLLTIILISSTFLLIDSFDERVQSTLTDIANISNGDRSGSIGLRLIMAEIALNKITIHPFTGNGLSDFHQEITQWANTNHLPAQAMERGFQNSHNQFLHWAQSLGIPCALVAAYMLFLWPLKTSKNVNDVSGKILKVFVFSCLVFFITEAVLDRHHGSMWYATHLGFMLGFVLQARQGSVQQVINVKTLT